MITIKFLGGAKKIFGKEKLELGTKDSSIIEILDYLESKMVDRSTFDRKTILVAVNGVDSSALKGFQTSLKDGDTVSIIPIIHGGSRRIRFNVLKNNIEIMPIKGLDQPVEFLDGLRKKYPDIIVQGISSRFVSGVGHVAKIVSVSLEARKGNAMISNKFETDLLMRFAGTKQISQALQKVGLKPNNDFILIVMGKKQKVNQLFGDVRFHLNPKILLTKKSSFLRNQFKISKKQMESVISETPLEDLLVEKASILFR